VVTILKCHIIIYDNLILLGNKTKGEGYMDGRKYIFKTEEKIYPTIGPPMEKMETECDIFQ